MKPIRPKASAHWAAWFVAGLFCLLPAACGDLLEDVLEDAAGKAEAQPVTGSVTQTNSPVPSGPHLYCITNIGHSMVAYSLTEGRVLSETLRVLELDPVGPWFVGGSGYYISRVESSGAGANALIEFDPASLAERRRLNFPGNSNPTTLLLLPDGETAYVALRGSTFDNFASNGLAVVELSSLSQTALLDFNDPAHALEGQRLASLTGLFWDAGCALGAPCIYGVVNNWLNEVRSGWLLVLEPAGAAAPAIREALPLGLSPERDVLLDGQGELWVVNNGGFSGFSGQPGTLQVLDTARFADGVADNETVALLEIGGDPTGIYPVDGATGWVTTYPDDVVRAVELDGNTLDPAGAGPPILTGPVITATLAGTARFAGLGGFGAARLAELSDPAGGTPAIVAEHDLGAGNGTVSCAEYDNP